MKTTLHKPDCAQNRVPGVNPNTQENPNELFSDKILQHKRGSRNHKVNVSQNNKVLISNYSGTTKHISLHFCTIVFLRAMVFFFKIKIKYERTVCRQISAVASSCICTLHLRFRLESWTNLHLKSRQIFICIFHISPFFLPFF